MAHVSTAAHKSPLPFLEAAYHAIATVFADFAQARAGAKTLKSLKALSDEELRDIGLERFEISEVAFGGKTRA